MARRKRFSGEYKQLMNSWQWQMIRAMVFNRDNYTCKSCKKQIKKPTKTLWLECNHLRYKPRGASFEDFLAQPLSDYECLCNKCHRRYTKESRVARKNLRLKARINRTQNHRPSP